MHVYLISPLVVGIDLPVYIDAFTQNPATTLNFIATVLEVYNLPLY